jgi:ubiquitin-conjugating enzyme E2 variant
MHRKSWDSTRGSRNPEVLQVCAFIHFFMLLFLSDLLIAIVHWAMDAYGDPKWPLLGSLVLKDNLDHHRWPRLFLRNGVLKNSAALLVIAALIASVSWMLGALTWQVLTFAGIVAGTNLIHRWAHQTRRQNGRFISLLQDLRIIQRREEHARHHMGGQDSHYAPVTNFVNPILEALNFWRLLECLVERLFGVKPRRFKRVATEDAGDE